MATLRSSPCDDIRNSHRVRARYVSCNSTNPKYQHMSAAVSLAFKCDNGTKVHVELTSSEALQIREDLQRASRVAGSGR